MLTALLLLIATPDDTRALLKTAAGMLTGACTEACTPDPVARSPFRLEVNATDGVTTSKDRAIREDGTRCSVDARRCTRKPRTLFRTDFTG